MKLQFVLRKFTICRLVKFYCRFMLRESQSDYVLLFVQRIVTLVFSMVCLLFSLVENYLVRYLLCETSSSLQESLAV